METIPFSGVITHIYYFQYMKENIKLAIIVYKNNSFQLYKTKNWKIEDKRRIFSSSNNFFIHFLRKTADLEKKKNSRESYSRCSFLTNPFFVAKTGNAAIVTNDIFHQRLTFIVQKTLAVNIFPLLFSQNIIFCLIH